MCFLFPVFPVSCVFCVFVASVLGVSTCIRFFYNDFLSVSMRSYTFPCVLYTFACPSILGNLKKLFIRVKLIFVVSLMSV